MMKRHIFSICLDMFSTGFICAMLARTTPDREATMLLLGLAIVIGNAFLVLCDAGAILKDSKA